MNLQETQNLVQNMLKNNYSNFIKAIIGEECGIDNEDVLEMIYHKYLTLDGNLISDDIKSELPEILEILVQEVFDDDEYFKDLNIDMGNVYFHGTPEDVKERIDDYLELDIFSVLPLEKRDIVEKHYILETSKIIDDILGVY